LCFAQSVLVLTEDELHDATGKINKTFKEFDHQVQRACEEAHREFQCLLHKLASSGEE